MESEKKLMKIKKSVCFGEKDLLLKVGKTKRKNSFSPINSDYFVSYITFEGNLNRYSEIALGAKSLENLFEKVHRVLRENYKGGRIIFIDGLPFDSANKEMSQKIRSRIDMSRRDYKDLIYGEDLKPFEQVRISSFDFFDLADRRIPIGTSPGKGELVCCLLNHEGIKILKYLTDDGDGKGLKKGSFRRFYDSQEVFYRLPLLPASKN